MYPHICYTYAATNPAACGFRRRGNVHDPKMFSLGSGQLPWRAHCRLAVFAFWESMVSKIHFFSLLLPHAVILQGDTLIPAL